MAAAVQAAVKYRFGSWRFIVLRSSGRTLQSPSMPLHGMGFFNVLTSASTQGCLMDKAFICVPASVVVRGLSSGVDGRCSLNHLHGRGGCDCEHY
jgi:hypothetical protein